MRAIIQLVENASVTVDKKTVGAVQKGYLILLGVYDYDTEADAEILAKKTAELRIFCDENDKMNLSLLDVDGEALVVSNFTLCADCSHGRRPSYSKAAAPSIANPLYELYCEKLLENNVKNVEKGVFGADMKVSLLNDGPVTLILDTNDWIKR